MTDHANPSGDPANDDSLAGVLRQVFRKMMLGTDAMLPAIVGAYDRTKNRATVTPCITMLTTDGRSLPRAAVASVPVLQLGGGSCVLNFPIKRGDLGWILASDRDISLFLQRYQTSPPNTLRLHSFEDALFIPDAMRGWTIAGEDANAVVLQTLDGTAKVSVQPGQVKLAVGAKSVTVTAAGTTIAGGLTVDTLNVTAGGTVAGGLIIDGVTFGTHRHADPQGGFTIGGPIN